MSLMKCLETSYLSRISSIYQDTMCLTFFGEKTTPICAHTSQIFYMDRVPNLNLNVMSRLFWSSSSVTVMVTEELHQKSLRCGLGLCAKLYHSMENAWHGVDIGSVGKQVVLLASANFTKEPHSCNTLCNAIYTCTLQSMAILRRIWYLSSFNIISLYG